MVYLFNLPEDQESLNQALIEIPQPRHEIHNPFTGEFTILTGEDMPQVASE